MYLFEVLFHIRNVNVNSIFIHSGVLMTTENSMINLLFSAFPLTALLAVQLQRISIPLHINPKRMQ